MPDRPLTVSVSVPTRNRPAHAEACVRSILATDGFVDLIVVDQSHGSETRAAIARIADPRLRYVASPTIGVTKARNIALALATSDILAFTDDDCRVHADWVPLLSRVFAADPSVGVVCGRVAVPAELLREGWAESFFPRRREWQHRYPPIGEWGITANMALRVATIAEVGAFDEMLGAGAPLRSGGEPDLLFRILRSGWKVVNADEVAVDHLGVRRLGAESSALLAGYGMGTAAAFFKHVRAGRLEAAVVLLRFVGRTAARVTRAALTGRRPTGAGFLLALLRGTVDSCRFPIDRARVLYRAPDAPERDDLPLGERR